MTEKKWNLYSIMHSIVGNDSGMIFGATGSGKSMFVRSIIQSAVQNGVKVAMCDTEANYIVEDIEWLQSNTQYTHTSRLQGITDWVKKLAKGCQLIVVDSIGGPAYGEYVQAGMKQAGDVFKNVAQAAFTIQQYCQQNGAMALLVNQPTSEFGGREASRDQDGRVARDPEPFGGKSGFYTKEVMKTIRLRPEKGWTIIRLDMFKSRHMRSGMVVANIAISDKSVAVKFATYQGRRPNAYPETKCVIPNPAMGVPEEVEAEVTEEPKDVTEIPIEEEVEKGEFDEGGEELKVVVAEICKLIEEKGISEVQFKAMMTSKSIDVEFAEQINDLDTANAVKGALETLAQQQDTGDLM